MTDKTRDYKKAIGEHRNWMIRLFEKAMGDFQQAFCDSMAKGTDFTIKLEARGNSREVIHYRVLTDDFYRPEALPKELPRKNLK